MVVTNIYCRFAAEFKKEANETRTAFTDIPSLLRWFQDDDPGQDSLQLFATPPPIIATIKNAANHPNFPVL